MLTKTTTILHYSGDLPPDYFDEKDRPPTNVPVFDQLPVEGDPGRRYSLMLDPQVWEELGRPETITVTIEPGDLLNPLQAAG